MAPQTIDVQSTSNAYFRTALNVKDILTVVNMQYYNSGSMLGCDGKVYNQGSVDFLTALACIQLENGLAPSQVGLGLLASTRGAGSGYVSPAVVNNALDCLAKGTGCGVFKPPRTYPDLRGAMTWSTNWDATAGNAWSNAVGPHVHGLP
jgi:chitinase